LTLAVLPPNFRKAKKQKHFPRLQLSISKEPTPAIGALLISLVLFFWLRASNVYHIRLSRKQLV
jgi:hypothetical protein